MTYEEALVRFKGDLVMMEQTSTHKTKQMEMYEIAIKALEFILEYIKGEEDDA
jgi:hypothetical protein